MIVKISSIRGPMMFLKDWKGRQQRAVVLIDMRARSKKKPLDKKVSLLKPDKVTQEDSWTLK